MAMVFGDNGEYIRFDIPNSEANINAQHNGIKDRTVGSYYMSDQLSKCLAFLSDLSGDYYLDLPLCLLNSRKMIDSLLEYHYEAAFKQLLNPQRSAIDALEWAIDQGEYYHRIPCPTINDQGKYLKLPNDEMVSLIKTLMLGDLTSLFIKRLGNNGYIIYFDVVEGFEELLDGKTIINWME